VLPFFGFWVAQLIFPKADCTHPQRNWQKRCRDGTPAAELAVFEEDSGRGRKRAAEEQLAAAKYSVRDIKQALLKRGRKVTDRACAFDLRGVVEVFFWSPSQLPGTKPFRRDVCTLICSGVCQAVVLLR
jgi:hypothetical protein